MVVFPTYKHLLKKICTYFAIKSLPITGERTRSQILSKNKCKTYSEKSHMYSVALRAISQF